MPRRKTSSLKRVFQRDTNWQGLKHTKPETRYGLTSRPDGDPHKRSVIIKSARGLKTRGSKTRKKLAGRIRTERQIVKSIARANRSLGRSQGIYSERWKRK